MAGQPLNESIKVYRYIRSQRDRRWNDSVAVTIKRLRANLAVIPGHEIRAGALYRDTLHSDFSPYMGEARWTAVRGFPIVYGFKEMMTWENAVEGLSAIDFPFIIGQDQFAHNITGALTGAGSDLFGDVAALDTDYNTGFVPNH